MGGGFLGLGGVGRDKHIYYPVLSASEYTSHKES